MDSSKTRQQQIVPLPVKEVTATCIAQLKAVPWERNLEGFSVPPGTLPQQLIPQPDEGVFRKLYVREQLLDGDKLAIYSDEVFANYAGRIFEVEQDGAKQLLLVGLSSELELNAPFAGSFPFLVYIPPSPQDYPDAHRKLFPRLYAQTPADKIPYFYKNDAGYPYAWDWLFFQFFNNMYRLAYQLKKANRPYVFVVPLVRSFSDGIGFLKSAALLERCLLGIQKFYLDEKVGADQYDLEDLDHVTLASFSIGDAILSGFIKQNRQTPFFRDRVKDLVVLDPPPGNPKNRSDIVDTFISILPTDGKKALFLYAEDAYYIRPLIDRVLKPKGIDFDLSKQKIFADDRLKSVFFAYLEAGMFKQNFQDPVLKDAHNTFPNLFINNAVLRSSLKFAARNGKQYPVYNFLSWAPGK